MITLIERKGDIDLYRLQNNRGAFVEIMNYGGRLHRLCVPDKEGNLRDVIAGFDSVDGYKGNNPYFNAIIGRVSNRIKNAEFEMNGKLFKLNNNEFGNHLHGGKEGFDRRFFNAEIQGDKLVLTYLSKDGEEHYPGNLSVKVEYSFDDDCSLMIKFDALSDEDTPVSLTSHGYFNLGADFDKEIFDTLLWINSSKVTEFDYDLLVTGKIVDIRDSAYDFRIPQTIGSRIFDDVLPLKVIHGYDNNYILDEGETCATAYCEKTGIKLTVKTDYPCLQFYSGNLLDGTVTGKTTYKIHTAFCLEPQMYPDSVNHPSFPSSILKKRGKVFEIYQL